MQWQDRSTPYSIATEQREHDGRTYAIDAIRDRDHISLHASARRPNLWQPIDQRISRIEVRATIRADVTDEDVRRVCDLMAEMCATLAREAE